jgi:hypothetical protein
MLRAISNDNLVDALIDAGDKIDEIDALHSRLQAKRDAQQSGTDPEAFLDEADWMALETLEHFRAQHGGEGFGEDWRIPCDRDEPDKVLAWLGCEDFWDFSRT